MSGKSSGRTPEPAPSRIDAGTVVRAALNPRSVAGMAREAALVAFHVATYPLGFLPARDPETPYVPRRVADACLLSLDPENAWSPVILVHGYFHNRSAFSRMGRALRRSGFQFIRGMNYNPLLSTIPELSERLAEEVDKALELSGASTVQIVGHSMGGIIARHYAQELAPPGVVDTVVTIGSPHRGTITARAGLGPAATALRPGSGVMRRLDESARPSGTRWISYYSDLDPWVLPASSAKLVHPALRATNVRVPNTGHLSLLLSGEVIGSIAEYLTDRSLTRKAASDRPLSAVASA